MSQVLQNLLDGIGEFIVIGFLFLLVVAVAITCLIALAIALI